MDENMNEITVILTDEEIEAVRKVVAQMPHLAEIELPMNPGQRALAMFVRTVVG